jgi:hypothetical protein
VFARQRELEGSLCESKYTPNESYSVRRFIKDKRAPKFKSRPGLARRA